MAMEQEMKVTGKSNSVLTRIDGLILILFFVIFIYYTFGINKVSKPGIFEKIHEEKINLHSMSTSIGMILLGLLGLYFGGRWIVDGAVFFALSFGWSESFIGLTTSSFSILYNSSTFVV